MLAAKLLQRLKVKSPQELVTKTHQAFVRLPYESSQEKIIEELGKLLNAIKECIFGEDSEHCNKDNALIIVREACKTEMLSEMVDCLSQLDFEAQKDVVQIWSSAMRIEDSGTYPGLEYLEKHDDIVPSLFEGYDKPEIALNCGQMFRECLRHEAVAAAVLGSGIFAELFEKLELANFEIASDAFVTFKDLLTRHKTLVAQFLLENYTGFFEQYRSLLESDNYVTRRQSVKLLGELLLDRANLKVMMMYVSDVANLKLMMNLLKDSSKSIQFEAFHVFKVFVANPNKTRPIVEVLVNNKEKLVRYLEDFHNDREDEQFKEEKAVILREISDLQLPAE